MPSGWTGTSEPASPGLGEQTSCRQSWSTGKGVGRRGSRRRILMTFPARASSHFRCHHHRLHFMAGIFQRPGSICIFKTSLMAWENCIFPVFLDTTLLPSSPILLGFRLYTLPFQKAPSQGQSKSSPHPGSAGGPGGGRVREDSRMGVGGHSCGQLGNMKLGPQLINYSSQRSGGGVPLGGRRVAGNHGAHHWHSRRVCRGRGFVSAGALGNFEEAPGSSLHTS